MGRAVGIDLGTTYSLVAVVEGGTPRCLPDESGRILVPSVVCFLDDRGTAVGSDAREAWLDHPDRTVYSVKRFMGKGLEDVRDEMGLYPYRLADSSREVVRITMGERRYTPTEVSAMILREVVRRAERALGETVDRAVITVPAYFNDAQRQATKDAGKLAGLEVLRILNEPTAAALAYGLDRAAKGLVAVYDLGGGTFDISVLKLRDGIFEVLSTCGDTQLGGDDIDRALAGRLVAEVRTRTGVDLGADRTQLLLVKDLAERAKVRLSTEAATEVRVRVPGRGVDVTVPLIREDLEALAGPIVERTVPRCRQALRDAGVDPADLAEVVLVGGQTRMPLVRRKVVEVFGREPVTDLDPDAVVALGAAVQAEVIAGGRRDLLLLDVTPLSLGIENLGDVMSVIISRNATVPTAATQEYTTSVDGQTGVQIHVLQGEREIASLNRSLARFELRIPALPAGLPRIEVRFEIDANGILHVSARDKRTGEAREVEVKPSYGLTDEEVETMLLGSIEHAESDMAFRFLIEARQDAEVVLRALARSLAGSGDFLSAEERVRIDEAAAAVCEAVAGEDHRLIRDRLEALESAAARLSAEQANLAVRTVLRDRRVADVGASVEPPSGRGPGPDPGEGAGGGR